MDGMEANVNSHIELTPNTAIMSSPQGIVEQFDSKSSKCEGESAKVSSLLTDEAAPSSSSGGAASADANNTNSNNFAKINADHGVHIKLPDSQRNTVIGGMLPGPSQLLLQPGALLLGNKYVSPATSGSMPPRIPSDTKSPNSSSANVQHSSNTYLQFMNNGGSGGVPKGSLPSSMANIQIPSMSMFSATLPNSSNGSPHMAVKNHPSPRLAYPSIGASSAASPTITSSPHTHAAVPTGLLLSANPSLSLLSNTSGTPHNMSRLPPHNSTEMSTVNSATGLNYVNSSDAGDKRTKSVTPASMTHNAYIPMQLSGRDSGSARGAGVAGGSPGGQSLLDSNNTHLSSNVTSMSQWSQYYQLPPNPSSSQNTSASGHPNQANVPNYLHANASLLLKSKSVPQGNNNGTVGKTNDLNGLPGYYMQGGGNKHIAGNTNTVNDIVPSASMFAMPYQPPFGQEGSNVNSSSSGGMEVTSGANTLSTSTVKKAPVLHQGYNNGPLLSGVDVQSSSSASGNRSPLVGGLTDQHASGGGKHQTGRGMTSNSVTNRTPPATTTHGNNGVSSTKAVKKEVPESRKVSVAKNASTVVKPTTNSERPNSNNSNATTNQSDVSKNSQTDVGSEKVKRKRMYKTSSAYYVPALGVGSEVWIVSVKKSGVVKEEKNGGWKYVLFHTPIVGSGVVPSKPSLEAAALHNHSSKAGKPQLDVIEGKWCRSCDLTSWPLKTGNGAEGDVGLHTGAVHMVRKRDRHRIPNVAAIVSANNMLDTSEPTLPANNNSNNGQDDNSMVDDECYIQQFPCNSSWTTSTADEEKHLLSPTASVVIDLRQKRARSLTCCSNDSDVQAAAAAVNVMRPRGGSDLYMYPILAADEDDQTDMLDDYANALTNEISIDPHGRDNQDYLSSDTNVEDDDEVDLTSLVEFDLIESSISGQCST